MATYQLSEEERKEINVINDNYNRLVKECDEELIKLRPDGYTAEGTPNVDPKDFETWLEGGSKKWKAKRKKRAELIQKHNETLRDLLEKTFDAHFAKIADDPDAIVEDACDEIDTFISETYDFYSNMESDFSAEIVRATEDGFLLDTGVIAYKVMDLLEVRHTKALSNDDERQKRIADYLLQVLTDSPLASSEIGELGGVVKVKKKRLETTEGKTDLVSKAQPLTKRTVLTTRLMGLLFDGKRGLEKDYRLDFADPANRHRVGLYSPEDIYKLRVAIDYDTIVDDKTIKLPPLSGIGKHIYNAIVSFWAQGIYEITFRQLWRVVCGAIKRSIKYGSEERNIIYNALLSFKANLGFSTGEILEMDTEGKTNVTEAGGIYQLLHYDIKHKRINGQITDVIMIYPLLKPVLLELAQALNGAWMTDNIDYFDVKGLENSVENLDLKDYLFIRIKRMKYSDNKVKQKKISLDTLVEDLGIEPFDKTVASDRKRKSRLVQRVAKILDNAAETGFIGDYSINKRKGSTEVISFSIELYKKKTSIKSVT